MPNMSEEKLKLSDDAYEWKIKLYKEKQEHCDTKKNYAKLMLRVAQLETYIANALHQECADVLDELRKEHVDGLTKKEGGE